MATHPHNFCIRYKTYRGWLHNRRILCYCITDVLFEKAVWDIAEGARYMAINQMNLPPLRENILQAAERLPMSELTNLVQDLLRLQARRQAPVLPLGEAELLRQINQGLSAEQQLRHDELIEKRLAETLTPAEQQELMQINQLVEQLNVTRIKNMIRLAQMRQITLPQLMTTLGIPEPHYVA